MRCLVLLTTTFLAAAAAAQETQATFTLPSGVSIRIVEAPFAASAHRITSCGYEGSACLIDGRVPFGSALSLPSTYVKRITATYKGSTYDLDSSQMFNAWGRRPLSVGTAVRYFGGQCQDSKNCAFRGLFSDAAGAFVAEWIVVEGTSSRTALSWSDDVKDLFLKNIDPPTYE